jgi:head-tail adaptor
MSALLDELTKYAQLWQPAATADGRGGQAAGADVPLRPPCAWVSLVPLAAGEQLATSGQRKPVRRFRSRLRYHPDVREGTRLTWQGRTFEVTSVIDVDEARVALELELVERTRMTGGVA